MSDCAARLVFLDPIAGLTQCPYIVAKRNTETNEVTHSISGFIIGVIIATILCAALGIRHLIIR